MATRYWVLGSGTWDTTTTTNWSTTSGGAGGASAPTSADDVIFDANSNVGTTAFTVTVGNTANCLSFSTGGDGGALDAVMTLSLNGISGLNVYGSLTLPASNFIWTGTSSNLTFLSSTTGNTITTNGVVLTATVINWNNVNGGWTLGSALTNTTNTCNLVAGSLDTGNYNVSLGQLAISGTLAKTLTLGSSTVTLGGAVPWNYSGSNLTLSAGTSTINCANSTPTFTGGGLTFYNVSFTSTTLGATITGANTYNNLSFAAKSAVGMSNISITGNQTINGTLTVPAPTILGASRYLLYSTTLGTPVTLTATAVSFTDTDFRDIVGAGAASWSGTRLGDAGGNTGITFPASKTVYWNLAGTTQNLSANGWATTQTGTPATTNFPLAQDTLIFTDTNPASGLQLVNNASFHFGTLDFSARTLPLTFASPTAVLFTKNCILSSAITNTSTSNFFSYGRNITQNFTSAGVVLSAGIVQSTIGGTLQLNDAVTMAGSYTISWGTLSTNYNLTCSTFNSTNTNTRGFSLGLGKIYVTGTGTVCTYTGTGLTITGNPTINVTSTGSTAIAVQTSSTVNSANINVIGGTYALTLPTLNLYNNLNFTGFAGSIASSTTSSIYGDLTLSTDMDASLFTPTISGTANQSITSNGKTVSTLTVNKTAGTLTFNDAFTASGAFTHTSGSFIANYNLTCASLNSSNTATRAITFGGNVVSLTGTGTVWNTATTTGLTFNAGASTISLTDNSATARTFNGGGLTYWNLQSSGTTGGSALTIIGNNTFNAISSNKTVAHSILFTAGSTTTLSDFVVSGSAGNLVTISSPTAAFHTLVKVGTSNVSCNYLNISYSHAS